MWWSNTDWTHTFYIRFFLCNGTTVRREKSKSGDHIINMAGLPVGGATISSGLRATCALKRQDIRKCSDRARPNGLANRGGGICPAVGIFRLKWWWWRGKLFSATDVFQLMMMMMVRILLPFRNTIYRLNSRTETKGLKTKWHKLARKTIRRNKQMSSSQPSKKLNWDSRET